MNILLDYFFPITAIAPTAQASTAFLRQACVVVKPKDGVVIDVPTLCVTAGEVAALTDNVDALELFNAGLSRVYILPKATLDLAAVLDAHAGLFFTLLISSDFEDADITAMALGTFKGVVGLSTESAVFAKAQAAMENRCSFIRKDTTGAKNLCWAFGKLLSNELAWSNQQYITMPADDDIKVLGTAKTHFDDKISFVLTDTQYSKRLGLFATGGKAIIAPYVVKNLEIDMQSKGLQYVSGNQPGYTKTQATLLEDELQKVIDGYVARGEIETGNVQVKLEQDNFVASSYINISEPNALWRILGQIKQTAQGV